MAASRNSQQAALKMSFALKVWLKICLALSLITFAPHANAIRIQEFQTYESGLRSYGRASPMERITGNSAYGFHDKSDVRIHPAEALTDSNPAVLTDEGSDSCSYQEDLQSTQDSQFTPAGMPTFTVTFTNTCLVCNFFDIHINCGDFASPTLLDPSTFTKLADGDCLLNGGGPLGPQDTITFVYESTFQFPMTPAKASVGC